jgi:hypothetical protein
LGSAARLEQHGHGNWAMVESSEVGNLKKYFKKWKIKKWKDFYKKKLHKFNVPLPTELQNK